MKKIVYIFMITLVSLVLISCDNKEEPNHQFSTFDPPKFELLKEQQEAIKQQEDIEKFWEEYDRLNRLSKYEVKIDQYLKKEFIEFQTYGEISIDELPPLDEETITNIKRAYIEYNKDEILKLRDHSYQLLDSYQIKYYYGTYSGRIFFSMENDYFYIGSNYYGINDLVGSLSSVYPPYEFEREYRIGGYYPGCPSSYEVYVYYEGKVLSMLEAYTLGEISYVYLDAATYFIAQAHPLLYDPSYPEINPRPYYGNMHKYNKEDVFYIYDENSPTLKNSK